MKFLYKTNIGGIFYAAGIYLSEIYYFASFFLKATAAAAAPEMVMISVQTAIALSVVLSGFLAEESETVKVAVAFPLSETIAIECSPTERVFMNSAVSSTAMLPAFAV